MNREEMQRQMYGITEAEIDEQVADSLYVKTERNPGDGVKMLMTSMLSDVQVQLEMGCHPEAMRRTINVVKYLINRDIP